LRLRGHISFPLGLFVFQVRLQTRGQLFQPTVAVERLAVIVTYADRFEEGVRGLFVINCASVVDAVAVLGRFLDALLSYHFRDFLDFGFSHIQRQIRKCKFRLIIALLRTF